MSQKPVNISKTKKQKFTENNFCCVEQKKLMNFCAPVKKLWTQMLTHPKSTVRAILDNFKVWLPVSPGRIKRSTIGNKLDWPPSLSRLTKKLVNFGPLSKKL